MGPGLLGNYVTVRHLLEVGDSEPQEVYVTYAHLSQNSMGSLSVGDNVSTSDILGETGFTGAMYSSDPDGNAAHLHIQFGSTVRPLGDGFIASAVDNEENYLGTTFLNGEAGALSPVDTSAQGFVSNADLAAMLQISVGMPNDQFVSLALSDFDDNLVRDVSYLATPINERDDGVSNSLFPEDGVSSTISFADAASDFGVSDGTDVAELYLESVLGSAISNVRYTGSEDAAFLVSDFEIPGVGIDLEGGILLSSGGYPGSSNTSTGFTVNHGTPGDDDLSGVAAAAFPGAGSSFDASVLEFDIFVDDPEIDGIRFDIIFGSDEYPEFSNTSVIDVAAVFVNGENRALFNGDPSTPLSVIDENLELNFVDNTSGTYAIEWDGFGALSIRPELNLGQNTIKIGVSDTGDSILDSAIYVTNFELLRDGAVGGDIFRVVNGAVGQNDLEASEALEEFNLAEGPGSISGTLLELTNDVVTGFTDQIELIIEQVNLLQEWLTVTFGSAILDIDEDGDGDVDGTITLEGDFTGAVFNVEAEGENTKITVEFPTEFSANDDSFVTNEDMVLEGDVLLNDTGVEGDVFTTSLLSDVTNGTLVLTENGTFAYIPNANFSGADSFTYLLTDGERVEEATVDITVESVNDLPIGVDDTYATAYQTVLSVGAMGVLHNDSDVEGDTLSAILESGPANGGLTLNTDGSFTYTPDAGFSGTDSFTYFANDGTSNAETPTTVSITVEEPPTINSRIEFIEAKGRDKAVSIIDGAVVGVERLRRLEKEVEIDAANLKITADDGHRWSPDFVTTAGNGIGVRSIFGDHLFGKDRKTLDDRETLSFHLEDGNSLGDALELEFEFIEVLGTGQVSLTFFDDGVEIDAALLDVEGGSVNYDLEGNMTFDRVEIGVEGELDLTIGAVEFLRLDIDELNFV